jgi:hypothetical protein
MAMTLAIAALGTALSGRGGNSQDTDEFQLTAAAAAAPERKAEQVGFRAFHDRLASYGQWLDDPRWGRVWRPNIRRGFRPYRQGRWVVTTEYGTVWVSDYPWGDIPFHYGRWFYDSKRGWLWVPGYVWGPAWVIWRAGEGKIGWMPMPPWIDYNGVGAFSGDWSDGYGYAEYGISPSGFASLWCFVEASDLYAPSIDYYVIGPGYNARFIDRTQGWTRYSLHHGHIVNLSIEPTRFRAAFGFSMRMPRPNVFEHHGVSFIDHGAARQIETHKHGVVAHLPPVRPLIAAHPVPPSVPVRATAHAPVVHLPPTKSAKMPRVYTHTEVVPYHPDSPSPPVKPPRAGPPPNSPSANPPH